MSLGGGVLATAPPPPPSSSTSTTKMVSLPPRRKVMAENWDDDFEFPSPVKPKAVPKRPSKTHLEYLGEGSRSVNAMPKSSPDSFDEDWDAPLAGPSRSSLSLATSSLGKLPSPASSAAPMHLQLPRSSHSHSPTLPSPTSSPAPSRNSTTTSALSSSPSNSTLRGGGGEDASPIRAAREALTKRSMSAITTPKRQSTESPLELHNTSPAHKSSPNLGSSLARDRRSLPAAPKTTWSKRVPVPPIPSGIDHTRAPSPAKSLAPLRPTSPTKQRSPLKPPSTPDLNLSKTTETLKGDSGTKKPKFWKRLSGGSIASSSSSTEKRRRSGSLSGLAPPSSAAPPVPPLPANLRSPSASSGLSAASGLSSTPSSNSGRRGSSIMKSSSSSLAQQFRESSVPLPISSPYMAQREHRGSMSSAHLGGLPHRGSATSLTAPGAAGAHRIPSPAKLAGTPRNTFSPGFHLPSPLPGSPYAMASTTSLALPNGDAHDSDTETEEGSTPISRRRVRPSSAMPAPRSPSGGLPSHELWKERNVSGVSLSRMPIPQPSTAGSSSANGCGLSPTNSNTSASINSSVPSNAGFAASTQSTLRRITSFSKKHSRRLSGGWKFGNAPSSGSSHESKTAHPLATVAGSPSKEIVATRPALVTASTDPGPRAEPAPATPVLPASTPAVPASSPLEPARSQASDKASPSTTRSHKSAGSDWDEPVKKPSTAKDRRRMTYDDFVIPSDLLAKQKELKRGIHSVKKFAGGVQALKTLVETHNRVTDEVLHHGTSTDTKLFAKLEHEYSQWWEMATVLIELGSTGADPGSMVGAGPASSDTPQARRATMSPEDARIASEAMRSLSIATTTSRLTNKPLDPGVDVVASRGPPPASPLPESYRASTGRHDLSQRQLDVLRTMLKTPVQSNDSPVLPKVQHPEALSVAQSTAPKRKSMPPPARSASSMPAPPLPTSSSTTQVNLITPGPNNRTPAQSQPGSGFSYVIPSPNYPSPKTAGQLAQGGHPRSRSGLAGLKDFLKTIKGSKAPGKKTGPVIEHQVQLGKHVPPPIDTSAVGRWGTSPPESPIVSTTPGDALYNTHKGMPPPPVPKMRPASINAKAEAAKRRRPSIKSIFRPQSGNWSELVRKTPPVSPIVDRANASQVSLGLGDEPSRASPRRGSLARPPSIPALARLKGVPKRASYGSLGVAESPTGSPTRPAFRHRPSVGAADAPPSPPPLTPAELDAARLKSRVLGLGHPSEGTSPRASSSPAVRAASGGDLGVPDSAPRSRSDGNVVRGDEMVIALTPENLPVLLDYVRQCERKLDEWRRRAAALAEDDTPGMW